MALERKEDRFIRAIRVVDDPDRIADATQASRVIELENIFKKLGLDVADCRRQGWSGIAKDEITVALVSVGQYDKPIALMIAGNNRVKAPPQYRVVQLTETDQIIQPHSVIPSGDLLYDQGSVKSLFDSYGKWIDIFSVSSVTDSGTVTLTLPYEIGGRWAQLRFIPGQAYLPQTGTRTVGGTIALIPHSPALRSAESFGL